MFTIQPKLALAALMFAMPVVVPCASQAGASDSGESTSFIQFRSSVFQSACSVSGASIGVQSCSVAGEARTDFRINGQKVHPFLPSHQYTPPILSVKDPHRPSFGDFFYRNTDESTKYDW